MITKPHLRQANEGLTARFWAKDKADADGWILVENLSIFDVCFVKFDNDTNDYPENIVKPLHSRPFQVKEGAQLGFSFATTGQWIRWTYSLYKPNVDEYLSDEMSVENVPWHADNVAITTTYNFTDIATYPLLRKQRISNLQVVGELGAFVGTVEVSDDGGATYGPAADLDAADPNKIIYELKGKWLTHVRVTVTGGTFAIDVW